MKMPPIGQPKHDGRFSLCFFPALRHNGPHLGECLLPSGTSFSEDHETCRPDILQNATDDHQAGPVFLEHENPTVGGGLQH